MSPELKAKVEAAVAAAQAGEITTEIERQLIAEMTQVAMQRQTMRSK